MCLRYMLLGGAMDRWMLHLGRFLTGVAGGMTAASIPVGYHLQSTFLTRFVQVCPTEIDGQRLM